MEIYFICSHLTIKYIFRFNRSPRFVIPVALNMLLTLVCWVGVYHMKIDERLANAMFGNKGESLMDSIKNGLGSAMAFVCVSFAILGLVMFDFRRIIQFFLSSASLLCLFMVSGMFFYAAIIGPEVRLESAGSSELFWVAVTTAFYGIIGCLAYFTDHLPSWVHRVYVVCNCSLISQHYLRILPGNTAWIVVVGVAFWELFSVLSPFGPFNLAMQKAADYNATILRFLIFNSGTNAASSPREAPYRRDSAASYYSSSGERDDSRYSSGWSSEGSENEQENEMEKPIRLSAGGDQGVSRRFASFSSRYSASARGNASQTAKDVWYDGDHKLGMGSFVFFSLLVGKAATSGSFLATAAAFSGVLCGLCSVVILFVNGRRRIVPVLPICVFFGITMHLMALHVRPLLYDILHPIVDSFVL